MAAPARGLTPTDLAAIRDALGEGRRPKVVFTSSAGQMAGNAGHVVELMDPGACDEWIVVQFGRDQLPFSPADLAVAARAASARRTQTGSRADARPTAPPPSDGAPGTGSGAARTARKPGTAKPKPLEVGATAPNGVASTATGNGVASTATGNGVASTATGNGVASAVPAHGVATTRVGASTQAPANGAATPIPVRSSRPAKPKAPTSLVVTLTYAEKEWTVAASQGSRTLAKPYPIKPAEALRMVALIDVPGVRDAVESIVAAERAEAEHRARRLRDELAEIESRLAELTARA